MFVSKFTSLSCERKYGMSPRLKRLVVTTLRRHGVSYREAVRTVTIVSAAKAGEHVVLMQQAGVVGADDGR